MNLRSFIGHKSSWHHLCFSTQFVIEKNRCFNETAKKKDLNASLTQLLYIQRQIYHQTNFFVLFCFQSSLSDYYMCSL
jgi:hypothetical protein